MSGTQFVSRLSAEAIQWREIPLCNRRVNAVQTQWPLGLGLLLLIFLKNLCSGVALHA